MIQAESAVDLAIYARGLTKSYDNHMALSNLNLTINWGSFTVVFGPNGSGKSTLIKILSTVANPTSGDLFIGGFDVKGDKSVIRKNLGVVMHNTLIYGDLTVAENLRFYGKMFGVTDLEETIESVASSVDIEAHLGKRIRLLSHGTQKKVSIARAILHDPAILLLDEPETGLDQKTLDNFPEIVQIGPRGKRTVLMTTHNLDRGISMGDQIRILSRGRISYEQEKKDMDIDSFKDIYMSHTEQSI